MKKNRNLGSSGWIRLPQKLLVMNLKILFLVCIVNTVSANSFSQLKKLNVDFSGQEITRVLDFLTTQTGYEFVYRKGVLNTGEKVTLELKEATAEQVLDALLKSRGYDYEIVDQVVVIRKGAAVYAPEIPRHVRVLQGTVKDGGGRPLPGVTVRIKGTTLGVATDQNGGYRLELPADKEIRILFSFVGMQEQERVVRDQKVLDVILKEEIAEMEEVIVTGYSTRKVSEMTGAVQQFRGKDIVQSATGGNLMNALKGHTTGLQITGSDGTPGKDGALLLRGLGTFYGNDDGSGSSSTPLIVIDGVITDYTSISGVVSPSDIADITVLKDAGSAAIYGTRGANGVILVTTKRGSGEAGKTVVTYDSYIAFNVAKPSPDILSADEFRRSRRGTDYGADTDWYGLITRDVAYDTNQYISIDGSTKNGFYGASFNYKSANGLDIVSGREEFGGRFSMEQRVLENRLQFNGSLSARRVNETWGNDGFFDRALTMNPTMPVYNADGSYYQPTSPTGATNPVAELALRDNNGQRMYLLGTAEAKLNILQTEKHLLNTTLSYSLHYNDMKQQYYASSAGSESYWNGYKGRAEMKYQKWYTNRLEWLGNYALNLGDHNIKAVVGYTYEKSIWEQIGGSNNDFSFDNTKYWDLGSGSYLKDGLASLYSGRSESTLIGFFGRLNYNWKDMLFASASLRYEGSSKFGANQKWGYFPAASLAWEMMEMGFMKNTRKVLTSLKPRVSFGITGRSDFDAYKSLSTYNTNGSYLFDGRWVTGYAPSSNANPDLAWEKSVAINLGVDFVLWNRLRGSVEYFDRSSKDLLYTYTAPQPPFVYSTILVNVGTTKNTGIEVSLDGDILTKTAVKWTSGINYSYGKTKLTKLSNDIYKASYLDLYLKPGTGSSEYFFRVQEGGEIGQFYGYEYAGVDENGNMLILNDKDEQIPISQADAKYKRYIGNGAPKHFLSWSNNLTWRNFDLSVFFRGTFGFDVFNMRKYGMGLQGCGTDNVLRSAYLEDKNIRTGGGVISSYFLEDGSFIKLENVTLGYNFTPKNRKLLDNMRIYLSAKNLFTLTGYSGNDPSIIDVNGIQPGVDSNSAYPTATQLSLGVTLRFK